MHLVTNWYEIPKLLGNTHSTLSIWNCMVLIGWKNIWFWVIKSAFRIVYKKKELVLHERQPVCMFLPFVYLILVFFMATEGKAEMTCKPTNHTPLKITLQLQFYHFNSVANSEGIGRWANGIYVDKLSTTWRCVNRCSHSSYVVRAYHCQLKSHRVCVCVCLDTFTQHVKQRS